MNAEWKEPKVRNKWWYATQLQVIISFTIFNEQIGVQVLSTPTLLAAENLGALIGIVWN